MLPLAGGMARAGGALLRMALRAAGRPSRGVAAVEMAVVTPLLLLLMVNVYDLASYVYRFLEVKNAAQMGAQAAWRNCDQSKLPATANCDSLSTVVTTAVQSTTLGTRVALSGPLSEAWYCISSAGDLQQVSDVSNKPANCAAVGAPNSTPGDYILVQVASAYVPKFPSLSAGALLPRTITASARMRLQ